MKKIIVSLSIMLITVCPWVSFGQDNIQNDPAYLHIDNVLDLKTYPSQININIPQFLLKDAISGLSETNLLKESGIDLADLVKDIKLIRVVVFDVNQTNKQALDTAVKTLQKELVAKWTPIVQITESKVNIYAMGDAKGESATGLALLCNDDDVIIINVVGHVSIAKIINIASKNNTGVINDVIKKLTGEKSQSTAQPAKTKNKINAGETTNNVVKP